VSDRAASVLVEHRDTTAIVTLNRPGRRNAVDIELCERLHERLREVAASDARVVVLRGSGNDFCVGADLKGSADAGGEPNFDRLEPVYHAATLLHEMPQITIAAVDGGCAGAGMGWACACDFRFASQEAMFSTAFLNVGVSGDMGLAWTLTRIVGAARARELLFFPEKFGSEAAKDIGLVTRTFPRGALHEETLALALALAARNPLALRLHKANLVSAEKLHFRDYVDIESARHLHSTTGLGNLIARASVRTGLEPK